jgi:hypothetical protein
VTTLSRHHAKWLIGGALSRDIRAIRTDVLTTFASASATTR